MFREHLRTAGGISGASARLRRSLGLGAIVGGLGTGALAVPPKATPPSSLAPDASKVALRPRHAHRIVTSCVARRDGERTLCDPRVVAGDASTEFALVPVQSPRIVGKPDQRARLDISLSSEGRPQTETIDVAAGDWELAWAGYAGRSAFSFEAGSVVRLDLESTTGRCDLTQTACSLTRGVTRTVKVSVQ